MPLFFLGWAPDYADPNDYVVPFLSSQGTFPATIGFSNATLDAMIAQAGSNPDLVTRDQQYAAISQFTYDLCPYICMSQAAVLFVAQSDVSGYYFNPLYSNLYYYDLSLPGTNTTFTYGEISGNPQYLDPARDYETAGGEVLQNCYETLVWYNSTNSAELVPQLCTEIPTIDNGGVTNNNMTYIYHIRPGVTFQNGVSLDAYDVQFSIERLLRMNDPHGPAWMDGQDLVPDYYSYETPFSFNNATGLMSGGIQNDSVFTGAMWCPDSMTIQFNLTVADPAWNSILAFNANSIVSLKTLQDNLSAGNTNLYSKEAYDWANTNVIGTGPYTFLEFAPSQYISMTRYDNYWRGPAEIKNVLLQQVADDTSRIAQIINGDLNAGAVPRAQQQTVFGQGLQIVNSSNWNVNFMGMNQDINTTGWDTNLNDIPSDFFADARVRQAFAHAWDFATFNSLVMKGVAIQPNGAIPSGMFGYHSDVPLYSFNLTQAAALLKSVPLPPTGSSTSITTFSADLIASVSRMR